MCGRYTLKTDPKVIAADFNVSNAALVDGKLASLSNAVVPVTELTSSAFLPNYNTAPTHQIPAVLNFESSIVMAAFTWGLVPTWAKDPSIGSKMINARSETVREKPSFRRAIEKRRCIIPADGWYEWHRTTAKKTPHYFSADDETLIGFAGIFETWKQENGETLWSCAMLTQDARPELAHVHDRMPVLVHRDLRESWIAPGPAPLEALLEMAGRACVIQEWEVGTAVGNVRNNSMDLIEPHVTLFG